MSQRIVGFDVARALAIFGMVVVNFNIAMHVEAGSALLMGVAKIFEGRASALFVILAGVGVTFLTDKARVSCNASLILGCRIALIKRGLLLVLIGLLYTPVWEADILHFYGFYFLIATAFFTVGNKLLLFIAFVILLMFPVLMLFFNYHQNWNWSTLAYENFWTLDGFVRRIFFNGFHPVFPWAAFLVFGMWLGRQELSRQKVKKRLLLGATVALFTIECGFYFVRHEFGDGGFLGVTAETFGFWFSTSIIPPLPQYMISAGSSAVIVIIVCLYFSEQFSESKIVHYLSVTGQLSLTLYVAHVVIGMGFLEAIGRLENQTISFSLLSALMFFLCGIFFSNIWRKYFRSGPLEWLFRKLAG